MLTQKAKYAMKALVYLAENNRLVKTKDIAENTRIPKKFLEVILLELKKHQVLESIQGAGGGYRLLKAPASITLASLYRIFEGPVALVPCASLNFYHPCSDCQEEATCQIRNAMIAVRDKTLEALENITLDTLTTRPE